MQNSRGQMTMEMILLMAVVVGVATMITRSIRDNAVMQTVVEGPWLPVRGMIEDGVWIKAGDDSRAQHPSLKGRHGSHEGLAVPP